MPTIRSGQRDTMNIETGRIKKDAEPKIALFDPQATPLATAISTYGREYLKDSNGRVKVSGVPLMKKVCYSPRFDWWEDELLGFRTQVNNSAGITNSDTTIEVDDYTVFAAGDIVWNTRTSELLEVNGTPSSSPVTFRRGVGASGTGVAMNDNDELIVIGNVYPEGSASRGARTTLETNAYNYTQIVRTPIEITRTLQKTELYTEDDWKYELKKNGVEHLKKIERTLWFGKREESQNTVNNTDGKPKRTTGGILNHFIATYVTTSSGTLTEAEWHNFLESALKNGSSMKYVFCAPRVLSVISNFAHGRLQVTKMDDKVFGLSIHEYQSPHGIVKLVRQPIFDESASTSGHAVAVDLKNVKYRFLKDSDTHLLDGRQANDVDGQKSEYLSEMGLQFQLEKESAVLKGVQG